MMDHPLDWLAATKTAWPIAAGMAADILFRGYRESLPTMIPVNLEKLAATLHTEIRPLHSVPGDARLVPVPGGFLILVDEKQGSARFRTSVAHELVHTLFYKRSGTIPTRIVTISDREEHFCFDVARRILVPDWLVELSGIETIVGAQAKLDQLLATFQVSKPVAVRLLLQDYCLSTGIAGSWSLREGLWTQDPGKVYASPTLAASLRKRLRETAQACLVSGITSFKQDNVVLTLQYFGKTAFVLAEINQLERGANPEGDRDGAPDIQACPKQRQLTLF